MLIREARFYIRPGAPACREVSSRGGIDKVPPGLSGLFTHTAGMDGDRPIFDEAMFHAQRQVTAYRDETPRPTYTCTLRLVTGTGMDAYATFGSGYHADELEWEAKAFKVTLAPLLVGVDAYDREYLWQRLWYAQRFFYTGRRPVDLVDDMLWDLASRQACLPVYKLLGACREQVPAYRNISGATLDELVADALRARDQEGFVGCKDHSYRGVAANAALATQLRAAVGDGFRLMHDPVESYTVDEAVRIGRVLERQGYEWIEEPLQDYDLMGLRKLCATLDLPVLALEWIGAIGGQPFNTAAFLALEAADIVRQRGVGITGQVKQAQLAESFGVQVHGGNPHVVLAISNDPLFEAMGLAPLPADAALDCRGRVVVDQGAMSIAWAPVRPAEPDWDQIERESVCVV